MGTSAPIKTSGIVLRVGVIVCRREHADGEIRYIFSPQALTRKREACFGSVQYMTRDECGEIGLIHLMIRQCRSGLLSSPRT